MYNFVGLFFKPLTIYKAPIKVSKQIAINVTLINIVKLKLIT